MFANSRMCITGEPLCPVLSNPSIGHVRTVGLYQSNAVLNSQTLPVSKCSTDSTGSSTAHGPQLRDTYDARAASDDHPVRLARRAHWQGRQFSKEFSEPSTETRIRVFRRERISTHTPRNGQLRRRRYTVTA